MKHCFAARPAFLVFIAVGIGLFAGCGGGSMSSTPEAKLTQIIVTPASGQVAKGATLQFSASGMFNDGKQRPLSGPPTWQTTESTIATVDAQGNVAGMAEGTAQISAAYDGITGTGSITVGAPALSSISVTPNSLSLPVGESQQFSATANFSDGTAQDITQSTTWASSDSSIAAISTTGAATAAAIGTTTITVSSGSITGNANLTVTAPAVLSLAVAPPAITVSKGNSSQLQAIATLSNGTTQDVTASVTWNSSVSTVAGIAQGKVTGLGVGTSQISASYQATSATAAVTVGPAVLVSIAVSPSQASLPAGESQQFTATGKYSDGSTLDLSASVVWSSSSANATISAGNAVAKAVGIASITAASGTNTGSASLTVTPAVPTALNVVPSTVSMVLQGSRQLRALATMSDGTTQDMTATSTWTSAQPGIATVSNGAIAGVGIGSTNVVAQANNFSASAGVTVLPLALINYYNRAASVGSGMDGTVQIVNPGLSQNNLCAMIYVFDQYQEMNECCGCMISPDGIRTLSVVNDLTANPLTGVPPRVGEVKIVPSDATNNPQCNAGSLTPNYALAAWQENPQGTDSSAQMTETHFIPAGLTPNEQTVLSNMCSFLQKLGSGKGICSCGSGD